MFLPLLSYPLSPRAGLTLNNAPESTYLAFPFPARGATLLRQCCFNIRPTPFPARGADPSREPRAFFPHAGPTRRQRNPLHSRCCAPSPRPSLTPPALFPRAGPTPRHPLSNPLIAVLPAQAEGRAPPIEAAPTHPLIAPTPRAAPATRRAPTRRPSKDRGIPISHEQDTAMRRPMLDVPTLDPAWQAAMERLSGATPIPWTGKGFRGLVSNG